MPAAVVTVRPVAAHPPDLAVVARIMAHYVEHSVATFAETAPTVAEWAARRRASSARGLPFLVAELDGEVVGFAYAAPWRPKTAYRRTVEDTVYVTPDVVGRGAGTALLGELVRQSGAAGCRQMIAVIADTGDPSSAGLHRRHGFEPAGLLRAVGFKHGRWIDTQLWQRALSP